MQQLRDSDSSTNGFKSYKTKLLIGAAETNREPQIVRLNLLMKTSQSISSSSVVDDDDDDNVSMAKKEAKEVETKELESDHLLKTFAD